MHGCWRLRTPQHPRATLGKFPFTCPEPSRTQNPTMLAWIWLPPFTAASVMRTGLCCWMESRWAGRHHPAPFPQFADFLKCPGERGWGLNDARDNGDKTHSPSGGRSPTLLWGIPWLVGARVLCELQETYKTQPSYRPFNITSQRWHKVTWGSPAISVHSAVFSRTNQS